MFVFVFVFVLDFVCTMYVELVVVNPQEERDRICKETGRQRDRPAACSVCRPCLFFQKPRSVAAAVKQMRPSDAAPEEWVPLPDSEVAPPSELPPHAHTGPYPPPALNSSRPSSPSVRVSRSSTANAKKGMQRLHLSTPAPHLHRQPGNVVAPSPTPLQVERSKAAPSCRRERLTAVVIRTSAPQSWEDVPRSCAASQRGLAHPSHGKTCLGLVRLRSGSIKTSAPHAGYCTVRRGSAAWAWCLNANEYADPTETPSVDQFDPFGVALRWDFSLSAALHSISGEWIGA
uniref:Uncharacterized protein n=1 Tax=Chromera velia CCMP2878 TaxID=1169474 RepID=A0A0G4I8N0_9ALVE|eukprot:Cvel_11902.t1-p1 / transcript=Cvel_11902.t1 / gene=Cvel_11902 / organism=Chromera_velia_CCMP2878 / gene_product=hypothetical protein / transcript_product=hypothetical protein / location=Cvel_scaffold761:58784-66146(+) / protein_length=287 / sequence_SO=supercontig / SO=protein_coding / is_pseudo=false